MHERASSFFGTFTRSFLSRHYQSFKFWTKPHSDISIIGILLSSLYKGRSQYNEKIQTVFEIGSMCSLFALLFHTLSNIERHIMHIVFQTLSCSTSHGLKSVFSHVKCKGHSWGSMWIDCSPRRNKKNCSGVQLIISYHLTHEIILAISA